jgi:photosystem II oxygen-evolving enhancer protein 2
VIRYGFLPASYLHNSPETLPHRVVLGDVQELGKALAAKRNARLVKASERLTEGILFYLFEFAINDGTHQMLQLCVCKGKLWSVDASSKESRWSKRAELYENVMGSFMPKLS